MWPKFHNFKQPISANLCGRSFITANLARLLTAMVLQIVLYILYTCTRYDMCSSLQYLAWLPDVLCAFLHFRSLYFPGLIYAILQCSICLDGLTQCGLVALVFLTRRKRWQEGSQASSCCFYLHRVTYLVRFGVTTLNIALKPQCIELFRAYCHEAFSAMKICHNSVAFVSVRVCLLHGVICWAEPLKYEWCVPHFVTSTPLPKILQIWYQSLKEIDGFGILQLNRPNRINAIWGMHSACIHTCAVE